MTPMGTFVYNGEIFSYGPCREVNREGFTEVVDDQDYVLAVALSPEIAIRGTKYLLDSLADEVDFVLQMLSKGTP